MATRTVTLVQGTTANAPDVMNLATPLYTSLDYTNFSVGALSGTGTKLLTDVGASVTFGSITESASSTGTSVTVATANAASIIIQNTDTTVNNFQSVDFKNNTGAIVGRIACINEDHTAATEDTSYSVVAMRAGALTKVASFNVSAIDASINNFVVSDGTSSLNQGMCIYTASNKIGILGFTKDGATSQGYVLYDHNTNLLTLGANSSPVVTVGSTVGIQSRISDTHTTITDGWSSVLALINTNSTVNAGSAVECYNSSNVMMGKIACVNLDNTGASEDSQVQILTRTAGTLSSSATFGATVSLTPQGVTTLSSTTTTVSIFSNFSCDSNTVTISRASVSTVSLDVKKIVGSPSVPTCMNVTVTNGGGGPVGVGIDFSNSDGTSRIFKIPGDAGVINTSTTNSTGSFRILDQTGTLRTVPFF